MVHRTYNQAYEGAFFIEHGRCDRALDPEEKNQAGLDSLRRLFWKLYHC